MITESEIQNNILKITLQIQSKFPELSKFIDEMPITIPDKAEPEINSTNLNEYYDSLFNMLGRYEVIHKGKSIK